MKQTCYDSRSLVRGLDVQDTVGVNLEDDLDLRNTTRSGGNASELELAEKVVILRERTFTLEDLDEDGGLVVGGSGEANATSATERETPRKLKLTSGSSWWG